MSVPCIACGGSTSPWLDMPIDAKTLAATAYGRVRRCGQCGHGSVFPLPSSSEVPQFYALEKYYTQGESHIPDVKPGIHDKVLTKLAWAFDQGIDLDATLRALKLRDGSMVCEIGCGHAENLVYFKERGHVTVGVDPDPKAVAQASDNGIEALLGTAEDLPERIRNNRFDLVIMSHSLEHCIDPALAIKNVASILRPGGLFVCEVPNSECHHFLLNNICSEMFDAPRHLHFYNTNSLRKSIDAAGLSIEKVEYMGFTRHLGPGWRRTELRIHQNLEKIRAACPPKHTFWRSLLLWLATFNAAPAKKYDSVRVVAMKSAARAPSCEESRGCFLTS